MQAERPGCSQPPTDHPAVRRLVNGEGGRFALIPTERFDQLIIVSRPGDGLVQLEFELHVGPNQRRRIRYRSLVEARAEVRLQRPMPRGCIRRRRDDQRCPLNRGGRRQRDPLQLGAGVGGLEVQLDRLGGGIDQPLVHPAALIGQDDVLPRTEPAVGLKPVAGIDMIWITLGDAGSQGQGLAAGMDVAQDQHLAHQRFDTGPGRPLGRPIGQEQAGKTGPRTRGSGDGDHRDHRDARQHETCASPGSCVAEHPGKRFAGEPVPGLQDTSRRQCVRLVNARSRELHA